MTVVANKSYFIRIYMGENGGGDNMIFSWNDTGDPANSTSNTMSYVKLDGSQSDKVLFYYNNPVQAKESNAPVDVSLGIVSWYDGASLTLPIINGLIKQALLIYLQIRLQELLAKKCIYLILY